jgi:hypothetical protein
MDPTVRKILIPPRGVKVSEHKFVTSVTIHSDLFSLEEHVHNLPSDDEDDDDEG